MIALKPYTKGRQGDHNPADTMLIFQNFRSFRQILID